MRVSELVVTPFAQGSVSLGLHPQTHLDATDQLSLLVDQALEAERAGFDGVTLSEHHAGFPSYLPQPLLVCGWLLHATSHVWSGPAPTLLGLRRAELLAEELAWTATRFPGRVAAVVAPGYSASDFEAVGADFAVRGSNFRHERQRLVALLSGKYPAGIGADAAVRAWHQHGGPLLTAVNSRAGVVVAAELGVGIMYPGNEDPQRLGELTARYREAGGRGPVVWTRGLWIGERPDTVEAAQLAATYREAAAPGMRQATGWRSPTLTGTIDEVADQLLADLATVGATAVNVRLHVAGVSADETREQIRTTGATLVPRLRHALTTSAR
jgi:alkanesulfonate monooxygenase SsuD/methylene tetrahydromethanopterin reductase-like flavin-dependent oxidoreductase (luciferase family)